jgi:hypothetical protein
MKPETIAAAIEDLKNLYKDVGVLQTGGRTLARIKDVRLPPGPKSEMTEVLIVFDPTQGRPLWYVKPGIVLADGRTPRSTSQVLVEGENWMQCSFQFPWDEERDSIVKFVGTALKRFGMNE